MTDTYIPKHDVHFMCDRHTILTAKGEYQAKCCACNAMQGCLDKETEEKLDKQMKKYREEKDIVMKQTNPEFFMEDEV